MSGRGYYWVMTTLVRNQALPLGEAMSPRDAASAHEAISPREAVSARDAISARDAALPCEAVSSREAVAAREGVASAEAVACGELLARLRGRDRAALGQIVGRHGAAMARAAYLYLGDAHAAEDAVQDAMLAAWDAAKRTNGDTPLRAWLLGIVLNRCRKHRRTAARRRRREQAHHELKLADATPMRDDGFDEQVDRVRAALAELTEPLRCVVILRYEQGLSVAQTAAALGVPEGTVKRRCHDALAKLRVLLRGER